MPRVAAKVLRQQDIDRLDEGTHLVGLVPGLAVQVIGDSRTYVLRFSMGERRRVMGLGRCRDMTLGQARDRARELRHMVAQGIDPIEARTATKTEAARQAAQDTTVEAALLAYIQMRGPTWKAGGKSAAQWQASLTTHAAKLMSRRVKDITDDDVVAALRPIWTKLPETASRVRARLEAILDYAVAEKWRDPGANPARLKGNIDIRLPSQRAAAKHGNGKQHYPALAVDDVPAFVEQLQDKPGIGAIALQFLLLTASRSGPVRSARWQDIDLKKAIWSIPADQMKTSRQHTVPLSSQATELLKALPKGKPGDLLFPAPRGGSLSDMALSEVMRGMDFYDDGRKCVPHGLRSTFANWGLEGSWAFELVDRALAHEQKSTVAKAYFRSDLLEQRRPLMQAWADFAYSTVAVARKRSKAT